MEEKKMSPVLISVSQSFIYSPETAMEDILRFIRSSLEGVERAEIVIKHVQISEILRDMPLPEHMH